MKSPRFWRHMRKQVFGGASLGRTENPNAVGPFHVLVLLAFFVPVGALGLWQVDGVFQLRDRTIHAGRAQEQLFRERDRSRELGAELVRARSDEAVRRAGLGELGLVEPTPDRIQRLSISEETRSTWRSAAEAARAEYARFAEPHHDGKEDASHAR